MFSPLKLDLHVLFTELNTPAYKLQEYNAFQHHKALAADVFLGEALKWVKVF